MSRLKLVWVAVAVAVLVLGIVGAISERIPNDVGLGPIYFIALGLLAFPLGVVGLSVFVILFELFESWYLGSGMHFSAVAYVCLAWCAVVGSGVLQAAMVRLVVRAVRGEQRVISGEQRDAS